MLLSDYFSYKNYIIRFNLSWVDELTISFAVPLLVIGDNLLGYNQEEKIKHRIDNDLVFLNLFPNIVD